MLSVLFQRVLRLFQDAPYSACKTSKSVARVQPKDSQAHSWDGDFFLFYGLMGPRFGIWLRCGRAGFHE